MTLEQQALREAVARVLYNRDRDWFCNDPTTQSMGDGWEEFADEVFPPWEEVDDNTRFMEDADAAIVVVLETAAVVAEDMLKNYDTVDKIPEALRALMPPSPSS